MTINTKIEGAEAIMEFEGWLDTENAPILEEELGNLSGDVTSLVFDFGKLEYISSAGLRQVVAAHKKMGEGNFKVIHTSDQIFDLFRLAGFDKKLVIEQ